MKIAISFDVLASGSYQTNITMTMVVQERQLGYLREDPSMKPSTMSYDAISVCSPLNTYHCKTEKQELVRILGADL